jgi:hypothetical protein
MVKKEWLLVPNGASPMDNWQNKIRHLRSYLRGWTKNMGCIYKLEKVQLSSSIDTLDLKVETILLSDDERRYLKNANDELAKLRRDEETCSPYLLPLATSHSSRINRKTQEVLASAVSHSPHLFSISLVK